MRPEGKLAGSWQLGMLEDAQVLLCFGCWGTCFRALCMMPLGTQTKGQGAINLGELLCCSAHHQTALELLVVCDGYCLVVALSYDERLVVGVYQQAAWCVPQPADGLVERLAHVVDRQDAQRVLDDSHEAFRTLLAAEALRARSQQQPTGAGNA